MQNNNLHLIKSSMCFNISEFMLTYNAIICFIFYSIFFNKQYFSKLFREKNLIELN